MLLLFLCVALFGATSVPARAQTLPEPNARGITEPSVATSMPQNGDPYGVRKALSDRGITYLFNYTNDVLANVSGGDRRGVIDQGKLEAIVRVDLDRLAGWQGLSFSSNSFVTYNTGRIRRDLVGGINTIAAIEATPSVRLSEIWLEQKFAHDKISFRFGQLAADTEFFFSDLSTMFLQSDWPTIVAQNLPSGGPAYPLSTPGARVKIEPMNNVALLLAIFNGDPAGPGPGDPDTRNRFGLNFRLRDSPLIIGETQVRFNHGVHDSGLATTLKFGGWVHTGKFADQRFASDGTSLANPAGNGIALEHRGDTGVYGIVDQQLYRPTGGKPDSGISVFIRGSISPSDRNQITAYLDGGIVFAGMIPGRPGDRFGASAIYARYSEALQGFDRDVIAFTGVPGTVRDYEANVELSYVAQIVPGWTIQPDFQYIFHPSGRAGRDAKVVGVRSMWRF